MNFNEYTCYVSTYRPVDPGYVKSDLLWYFEDGPPLSVYKLFKLLRQEWELKSELLGNEPNAYEQLCKKYDGNAEMLLKIKWCYDQVVLAKNTGKPLTRMPAS